MILWYVEVKTQFIWMIPWKWGWEERKWEEGRWEEKECHYILRIVSTNYTEHVKN